MPIQLDLFDSEIKPEEQTDVISEIQEEKQSIEKKCLKCNNSFSIEKMVKNKNKCKVCKKLEDDNRRSKSRKYLFDFYLSHPCVDCGETNPFVLQLDHIGQKRMNVSEMVSSRICIETIKKEIEQCVVRCSNCHAKKTAKDQKWYKEHYDHDKEQVIKEVDKTQESDIIKA
jgi:hypothetical protein